MRSQAEVRDVRFLAHEINRYTPIRIPTTATTINVVCISLLGNVDVPRAAIDVNDNESRKMAKFNCKSAGDPLRNNSNSLSLISYKSTDSTLPRRMRKGLSSSLFRGVVGIVSKILFQPLAVLVAIRVDPSRFCPGSDNEDAR